MYENGIENLTDQLLWFAEEVEKVVSKMVNKGYSKDQAIEIVRIGVEDIKAETMHHKNEALYEAITNQYLKIDKE
ncbi:hypothetical protein DWV13_09200 [Clostridium botulinum]|uniref:hypothetical protein n=1 Tax=Clostridium TaxID=1485 RepID=UPI0013F70801|nr:MULTISPECIES: hypothetical protein [Clostridium]MCS6131807.1 hypothetical protein [Clostridium botulinum]NFF80160.1 hypothetical protein [Clostridium botulinum]NFL45269.1 hypothetical protein [Clostridium botulinum]NFL89364.1 hypothetical protein [Clostridium botulinum]